MYNKIHIAIDYGSRFITVEKEDFVAWLNTVEPNLIVGAASMGRHCPIKNFLSTMTDLPVKSVDGPVITLFVQNDEYDEDCFDAPDWISLFVELVDNEYGYDEPVSAAQALEIMEKVNDALSGQ